MRQSVVLVALVGLIAAGCATTQTAAGRDALRQGRPAEAAEHFQTALAEDPGEIDAQLGLGVSRYRLGDFDGAIAALADTVAKAPTNAGARIYLALAYLQTAQDAPARVQLGALRGFQLEPRFAALVERTMSLLDAGLPSPEVRRYVAQAIDDGAEWSRELVETRRDVQLARFAYDPFWDRPTYLLRYRLR